jgi:splicing factor 3B subunit 3
LNYTPRKMVGHHDLGLFYVIQSEINTLNVDERQRLIARAAAASKDDDDDKMEDGDNGKMDTDANDGALTLTNGEAVTDELPPVDFGYPRVRGRWASCIQVVDPVTEKAVTHTVHIKENQSLVSAALVYFEFHQETFLVVGAAENLSFQPYAYSRASIMVFKLSADGRQIELYHETEVPAPALALIPFKGKMVAGVGRNLGIYDCGYRTILRKAQASDCVPTRITDIKTQGSRLIVSDQASSVTYVVHKDQVHPNRLIPFADDIVPRHTTCTAMMDYDTTVGGDKFGNLWVLRCEQKVSEASDESPDGSDLLVDKSVLGGTAHRLNNMAEYFANDIPVSIQKTILVSGGDRIIVWAGLQGTLGVLIPFTARRQYKMFQQLELQLRQDDKSIAGRDHLSYRSYFNTVKCIIDGDLIERFLVLPSDKRASIAAQLPGIDFTPAMIDEAIWNMRSLFAF